MKRTRIRRTRSMARFYRHIGGQSRKVDGLSPVLPMPTLSGLSVGMSSSSPSR
jgi:hypothetical protein